MKVLQMTNKPKNIGKYPIDGDDEDIYSYVVATNEFSILNENTKYVKNRPPPTYIDYFEYKNASNRSIFYPMQDLQIREDINRIEWVNEVTNENNRGLKAYAMKQIAKNFFRGVTNFSLPAYVFDPVSNVSQFINNFRTAPYFLQKAIYVSLAEPYERIKLITAMWVSRYSSYLLNY